jgi:hypothetical protein
VQKKSFIGSGVIFSKIFQIRGEDNCSFIKAEGDKRRITMEWGNLKLKGDLKGITFYLTFFKNLTFLCSLGKFLLIENFSSILIKSPLLNG